MIDLLIRGGQVVTPWGVGDWDVAVEGEKIAAVASPGSLPGDVGRVMDAAGKIVVPGGIEPHAHIGFPVPGRPGVESAGPEPASRAALFGGTTTVTDFAMVHPGMDIPQAIAAKEARWRGQGYCDHSYHCTLLGNFQQNVVDQVKEAIQSGYPTFKMFTTNIRQSAGWEDDRHWMARMGHVNAAMEQAAAHGGMMFIHSEDDDIVQYMYKKLTDEERTQWYYIHEIHNNMSEDVSFRRILKMAEWTGAATYFVHVSAKEGVRALEEARGRGFPLYAETLHNYVSFNADDYRRENGPIYHTYPSLKSEEDRLALWDGLLKGTISCMATDGSCTDFSMKMSGKTILDVTGGHHGVETRMGITYGEGVVKRGMSLRHFVDATSTNAAKIMGYYPRKGAIAPGSDADIVFIDPTIHKDLELSDLHLGDYSVWEGWEINGWPVTTILRGKVMVENGQFFGTPGDGKLIPRKVGSDILNRPLC